MWRNRDEGRVARDEKNPLVSAHVSFTGSVRAIAPEQYTAPADPATSSLVPRHSPLVNTAGFTLLEMVIVVILISILGLFALDRFWSLRVAAERAGIQQVVGNIRSALGMEVARYALENRLADLPRLDGGNPMLLLAQTPAGYIGKTKRRSTKITEGNWYFDPDTKTLNYRIIYAENRDGAPGQPAELRWRIRLVYRDRNASQQFEPGIDAIEGLDLIRLTPSQSSAGHP